jgi:hypothetical protein
VLSQQHDEGGGQETKFETAKFGSAKPRDSQIGVVAEHSPGCSCFNYTFHTGIFTLCCIISIDIYLIDIIYKFL